MIKSLMLTGLLSFSVAVSAQTTDWSMTRGGASAYVGTSTNMATFFYAANGESLTLFNLNQQTIRLYCGVAGISDGVIFARGYASAFGFSVKKSDLYVAACVKASGISGDTIVGVFNDAFFRQTAQSTRENPQVQESGYISPQEQVQLDITLEKAIREKIPR